MFAYYWNYFSFNYYFSTYYSYSLEIENKYGEIGLLFAD